VADPIQVSKQTARRFVLGKQGLWPGRRWSGKKGTRAAIVACEHLQLDPLVIVARSHDLMLHARVARYEPRFFDELTYGEREFFDWGGWLAVRPMSELPYWRTLMRRDRERSSMRLIAEQHADAIVEMRGELAERGTIANRQLDAKGSAALDSYRGSKESSLALYYLWRTGEAMTHHRNGFERVYAPTDAVAPAHLLTDVDEAEVDRFMVLKGIAFAGIGRLGPVSDDLARTVTRKEVLRIEQDLVASGDLTAVEVEGTRATQFMLTADVDRLATVARGRVPREWKPSGTTTEDEVTLLSPLDPACSRKRAKLLFDFDFVWEIYKKAEDVKFGRYTMPILWGDRLVGRIDPRLDRPANTLVVNGIWLEHAAHARDGAFVAATRLGVQRFMEFLGADRIDVTAVKSVPLRRALAALNPKRGRSLGA
jgi:uncharacterized protein YcaQ